MIINSIEAENFRNYSGFGIQLSSGRNIIYGENAQGKTNILEAVYVGCSSRSHRSAKDREMIKFGEDEAHIKLNLTRKDIPHRIDIHIKKNKPKGIAIDGIPIKKTSELIGLAGIVFFSPEDLGIIKNSPSERRRFIDVELCQLSRIYTHLLISYNSVTDQKNRYLKDHSYDPDSDVILDVYNEQLVKYGKEIIEFRRQFIDDLNKETSVIHSDITAGKEKLDIIYECNTGAEEFASKLENHRASEKRQQMCLVGPHRDDISFLINNIDARHYGSQGQQRTAALSLKLSEIEIIEKKTGDRPVLLLDDVLSELDSTRQNMLLDSIKDVQALISCTGLDDFVSNRFVIDRIFRIKDGKVIGEN